MQASGKFTKLHARLVIEARPGPSRPGRRGSRTAIRDDADEPDRLGGRVPPTQVGARWTCDTRPRRQPRGRRSATGSVQRLAGEPQAPSLHRRGHGSRSIGHRTPRCGRHGRDAASIVSRVTSYEPDIAQHWTPHVKDECWPMLDDVVHRLTNRQQKKRLFMSIPCLAIFTIRRLLQNVPISKTTKEFAL